MAKGRKAKPTAIKRLQGNPGRRPINKNEPKPQKGFPSAPVFLDAPAKRVWRHLCEQLSNLDIVTRADKTALTMLCSAYADWYEANETVQYSGSTYKTETEAGNKIYRPHPAVAMRSDAWRRVVSLLAEFGLTPASRTKFGAKEETADPMLHLLTGGAS